jgi:hypothetical protein
VAKPEARPDTWGDLGGRNAEKDAPRMGSRGASSRGAKVPAGRSVAMVLVEGLTEAVGQVPTDATPAVGAARAAKKTDDRPMEIEKSEGAKDSGAAVLTAVTTRFDEASLRVALQGFLNAATLAGAEAAAVAFPTASGTVALSPLLDTTIELDTPAVPIAAGAASPALDRTWLVEGPRAEVAIVLQEISTWSQARKFTLRSGESKPTASLQPPSAPSSAKNLAPTAGPSGPATGGSQSPTAGGFVDGKASEPVQVVFRLRLHARQ